MLNVGLISIDEASILPLFVETKFTIFKKWILNIF